MNENEQKNLVCPMCHNICNFNDTFCCYCGHNLTEIKNLILSEKIKTSTKYCPKCGKVRDNNQKYCSECGYSFEQQTLFDNTTQKHKFFFDRIAEDLKELSKKPLNKAILIIACSIVFGICLYLGLKIIGSVPDEVINSKTIQEEDYVNIKAKSCHEKEVKDTALQIFKENDYYFKYIAPSSISDVNFKFPAMDTYNMENDKYYCSATIIINAKQGGFKPSTNDLSNHYYEKISNGEDNISNDKLKKYTKYQCEINYASQISQDQVYVTATACGNGMGLDLNNIGKFTSSTPVQQKPVTEEVKEDTKTEESQEQPAVSQEPTPSAE